MSVETERTPVKRRCVLCDKEKTESSRSYTVLGKGGWANEQLCVMVESLSGETCKENDNKGGNYHDVSCSHESCKVDWSWQI